MHIVMKRAALMERLNDRLKAAQAEDKRAEKAHHDDEAQALKDFRALLREALKWDYQTAKKKYFSVERHSYPKCPSREANRIEGVINMVKLDTRVASFRIQDNSDIGRAINWLPASERPTPTVC